MVKVAMAWAPMVRATRRAAAGGAGERIQRRRNGHSIAMLGAMGAHSAAEAKDRLSELIDRALAGEGVTMTRHGRPVVELRTVDAAPGPVRQEDLDWLAARRSGRGPAPACDAGRLLSEMRDEGER